MQGSVLELPGLKDYSGMPLIFRSPGLLKRCVSEETLAHPYVQKYLKQRMLVLEGGTAKSVVAVPAPVPAVSRETAITEPAPAEPEVVAAETAVPTVAPEAEPVALLPPVEPPAIPDPTIETEPALDIIPTVETVAAEVSAEIVAPTEELETEETPVSEEAPAADPESVSPTKKRKRR